MGSTTVETFTASELRHEIAKLQEELGLSLDVAEQLEFTGHLTYEQFTLLQRIRGLKWLAEEDE